MVENPQVLKKIRERLGTLNPLGEGVVNKIFSDAFSFLESEVCDPQKAEIHLSAVREALKATGEPQTPLNMCTIYLGIVFSVARETGVAQIEQITRLSKPTAASLLDIAGGAEFVISGIEVAHKTPPPELFRGQWHVVHKLIEEDPTGLKVIDWCIERVKKRGRGIVETPFGELIDTPDPVSRFENRELVAFGAGLFRDLYTKLYPLAERICSESAS